MNTKTLLRRALSAGLLLGTVVGAAANSLVTFQVDMSAAAFDPGTQTVTVRGNFNGWGSPSAFALTNNPSGPTPSVWTGTADIAQNGTVIAFKYVIESGTQYEGSHNRLVTLPSTSGGSVTAPLAYYNDTPPAPYSAQVKFQVDMAQQINTGAFIPSTGVVQTRGGFNGWAGGDMTNDPTILRTNQFGLVTSNVYVLILDIPGSPGQTFDFKYHFDAGDHWEAPTPGTGDPNDNNNRFFSLSGTGSQTLPVIFFNDAPYAPVATNAVMFQVDMTAQVLGGNFDPVSGTVEVRGDFNGWGGTPILLTNNPAGPNTNLYTIITPITDGVGANRQYKFYGSVTANGGWEIAGGNPGLNRVLKIVSGPSLVLPAVYFSDTPVGDVLTADTVVTFRVDMTGAVGTDNVVFNPATDNVYVGGLTRDNLGRWNAPFTVADSPLQMTNNPVGSMIYTLDVPLPRGVPVALAYKFGINGVGDEPLGNHVRYIYSTGAYTLPLDKFGAPAPAESAAPNLKIAPSTPGHVQVSWLGRPGVHLQTKSSLGSGSWVDNLQTDGQSSLDVATSGQTMYFRSVKP